MKRLRRGGITLMTNRNDRDWLSIIAHYKVYTQNSDVIKELFEAPIKQAIVLILAADWILLRLDIDMNRSWVIGIGILIFPFYILFKYWLGSTNLTLKLQNRVAQSIRNKNDDQFEKAFEQIDEIHRRIREV